MSQTNQPPTTTIKFNALLNPIRDLAASWGVDIAKELSDYATHLGIDITQPIPTTTHNPLISVDFAQAALLVSSSASIYSRKVEHLYTLVYLAVSTLNKLHSSEKSSTTALKPPSQHDVDADALLEFDEADFLTLDDHLPQAHPNAITLPHHDLNQIPASVYKDDTLLPPVPPMLVFRTAESASALGKPCLRISNSHTHASGALIMQGCPPVTENLDSLPVKPFGDVDADPDMTQPFVGFDEEDNDDVDEVHPPIPMSPDGATLQIAAEKAGKVVSEHGSAVGCSRAIMETAALYGVTAKEQRVTNLKPVKDPFSMLDPHQPIPDYDKPLKVGKTYRRPRVCNKPSSATGCQRGFSSDRCLADTLLGEIPQSASIRTYVSASSIRGRYGDILKQRSAAKRKIAARNQQSAKLVQFQLGEEEGEEEEVNERTPDIDDNTANLLNNFEDNYEEGHTIDSPEHLRLPDNSAINQDDPPELSLFSDSDPKQSLCLDYTITSFEETCRKYLEQTAWMWEQRTTDVNLIRRVEDWKDRIQPLLDEEELRSHFDIALCAQGVLHRLESLSNHSERGNVHCFDLYKSKERYNVSRMFLATLQLTNDYSVQLLPPEKLQVSAFHLKLPVSTKKADELSPPKRHVKATKRARQASSTPKSARRQPLRPRLEPQKALE